jgi:indolepyruvate ferredoxin oxidoreductase beta subunit
MSAAKGSNGVTNVLIVGVGGQGVIMVSRVLAELSMRAGYQLKQSEVHGMAKRGGGVYSHVRFGEEVWSPTIPVGEADILLGLEWAEALRWLEFMRPEGGTFIADTQQIVPPFSCRDRRKGAAGSYTPNTPAEILEHMDIGLALDASRMAEELGNLRVSNTILLGALSTALEFAEDEWLEVLAQTVPPKTVELNHKAFKLGREWPEKSRDLPPPTLAATSALPSRKQIQHLAKNPENDVQWAVTDEWCKGCDICVKMCPERCLALDGEQVPRMENPEACTGCRICEWLCPDYAISVHTGVSAGAPAELPISERTGA